MNFKSITFAGFALAANIAAAAPVVVTPASMAGYNYFPPPPPASSTGGGGSSDSTSTLQRCVWQPSSGDQTVTASNFYDYDKEINVYYRMAGGNGGAGITGGGGGSSAILKNGTVVAIGPGGNGQQNAAPVSGTFKVAKNNTVRFITGGGGGDGIIGNGYSIGGGGGAGYTGGGGGASANRHLVNADYPASAGKGGSNNPGDGGSVTSGMNGTSGSGMNGGVATFPNGNTTPTGNAGTGSYSQTWNYYDYWGLSISEVTKHMATTTRSGAPAGGFNYRGFSGGGGRLGAGGQRATAVGPSYCNGSSINLGYAPNEQYVNDNGGCYTYYNWYTFYLAEVAYYPASDTNMALTRRFRETPPNNGYLPIYSTGGTLPGQIVLMYQAPTCEVFQ